MARRRRVAAVDAAEAEKALLQRHDDLARGATAHWTMDEDSPAYGVECSAWETIYSADNERRKPAARLASREDLLASMGRLDRGLRHVRYMERFRKEWSTK